MEKTLIIFASLCILIAAYSDIDDSLDPDKLIKNKSEFQIYINCFVDKGPCTPAMAIDKSHLVEAVKDGCQECDEKQKHMLRLLFKGIKETVPELLNDFKAKYDPDGTNITADEKILEKYLNAK